VQTLGIPVNDLFTLASLEHFSNDGVHFTEQGSAVQAEQVSAIVANAL
jgi:lysophospholipase L1-like esterase